MWASLRRLPRSEKPLRQEPEWQLNDLDVQEAWRQIDQEALDKCSPSAMLALASDVVKILGRWPAVLSSCGCPQERRLEVRLALILNAYVGMAGQNLAMAGHSWPWPAGQSAQRIFP